VVRHYALYIHIHKYTCKSLSFSLSRFLSLLALSPPTLSLSSDISSIDHLVMREFVSGSPRYHLAIKGVREQFVVLEQRFRAHNQRYTLPGISVSMRDRAQETCACEFYSQQR